MANEATTPVTSSYLDFAGLARLRGEAQRKTDAGTHEAAQQFEAMFVQMMLKSMRDASFKSDLMGSQTLDTYQSMHDHELSLQMARRGSLGIATMIEKQFAQTQTQVPAADQLALREKAATDAASFSLTKKKNSGYALPGPQPALEIGRPKNTGFDLQREFKFNRAP